MKVYELFESQQKRWRAIDVVRDILGPNNVLDDQEEDSESTKPHQFLVTHSWTTMKNMFSDMDCETGCICLDDRYGTSPRAVAIAAHESFHAWLHMNKKQYDDEKHVNQLATQWLQKNTSGMFLHAALNTILHSKIWYGHN